MAGLPLSPESVTWLVVGGVLVVVVVVVGGPNIRPSSGGGLGEPKRMSDPDFAAAGGDAFFGAAELWRDIEKRERDRALVTVWCRFMNVCL